jgi:hypothetical protein
MVTKGLLDLHSAIRYLILILLVGSLFTAYRGLLRDVPYTRFIGKWNITTRILINIQALTGLTLYFLLGLYHAWTTPA